MAHFKYDPSEAITNFFKSAQCKTICVPALFALCSIGLLQDNNTLIQSVFKEFDKIDNDPLYRFDILKYKSFYYCYTGDYNSGIKLISKYIHDYPNESKGWTELCFCLKKAKQYSLALNIAKSLFRINDQAHLNYVINNIKNKNDIINDK
jgi:hypothetical protein